MLPFNNIKLTLDPSKHRQFEAAQTAIIIDWRNRASSFETIEETMRFTQTLGDLDPL
jgi:hypothetical protein